MEFANIPEEINAKLARVQDVATLDQIERDYLGRKGVLSSALRNLKTLNETARRESGLLLNETKKLVAAAIAVRRSALTESVFTAIGQKEALDITAPGARPYLGRRHPISLVTNEMVAIARDLGFLAIDGPEVETDFYNFTALNIPADHPARDMWSTFWLAGYDNLLLRTHTSPMQARYLKNHNPPFRIVVPGRTYRYEATDRTHEAQFSQLEGLLVDRTVSVAEFRGIITEFLRRVFNNKHLAMRLRPSYFPFVEPGFEVDMACVFCKQRGCEVCKQSGWLEMMGAGLVHPQVFKNMGYDPNEWQGFAFGIGVERVAMLKYNIKDIRVFYSGDARLTRQF